MTRERILVLDRERINWKLQRMAYEIWEHNSNEKSITLIGIHGSGLSVAHSLAERLKTISGIEVNVLSLKLNKRNPVKQDIKVELDFGGSAVVLVDDVANSGKTLLYALRPLLDVDLKKIMIAVLVDRKHKAFPVSADIVGHTIATTLQEHIEVETLGDEITAVYLQ